MLMLSSLYCRAPRTAGNFSYHMCGDTQARWDDLEDGVALTHWPLVPSKEELRLINVENAQKPQLSVS